MAKMNELLANLKKAEEEKQCNKMKTVLAIIGVIVVIAGIAFAVYKFMTKCKKELECCDCDCDGEEDNCIEIAFVDSEEQEAAEKSEAAAQKEEAVSTDAAEEAIKE